MTPTHVRLITLIADAVIGIGFRIADGMEERKARRDERRARRKARRAERRNR